jgi:hypothetical protein
MHDTARCFGYPSDSSRTARKRAGTLGWAGPRHWQAPPSDARPRQRSILPPPPPCRLLLTALTTPTGGVGRCLQAEGHGCLLGCLGLRRIAGTTATVGPARGGRGAGSGPELPRVDRHQRRLRGRGSLGPDLSLARLLGGRLALLFASSARLRWPGAHRVGRSLATTTPSWTEPAGGSYWAADGLARARGSSSPGRLCHCNGPG